MKTDKLLLEFLAEYPDFNKTILKDPQVFKELRDLSVSRGLTVDTAGDLLIESNKLRGDLGQVFTPMWIVTYMVDATIRGLDEEVEENRPVSVLDPAAGTGRFGIGVWDWFAKNAPKRSYTMTNVEIDPSLFDLLVFNMLIREVPSTNLLADTLLLGFDRSVLKRGVVTFVGNARELSEKELDAVHESFAEMQGSHK